MDFQKFIAWENLPSLTSKSDALEFSSSKSASTSEYESEGYAVPKVTVTKIEAKPIPSVEIPPPIKHVLDKIDMAQLERAKKEVSKKLFCILENVNRTYERYKKDDGIDPAIEKEYSITHTWEEKSRRSCFLDEIDDVLNDNMDRLQDLRLVLESLKEWNGMLKKVELQEKISPDEEMIDKMEEDLMNSIEAIEANVRRLIRLFQPLLTEKIKTRRKSGQRSTVLFKAWRDKVADMPQESEPLTPEQMLEEEPLTFTRCHDVNNMLHELGESSLFNKAEIVALKYIAAMVANLIKAFGLLVKQCRNLKLKCDNLIGVEGRKQDPQVAALQRELRMALEKKTALEKQVQSAEERCMALLITNEMIQKQLHDANEKALLAGDVTFSKATSSKAQSKSSERLTEKDVKSKQEEKPKLHTELKKKLGRKGEGESSDEKWESPGDKMETSQATISGKEQSPAESIQDTGTKQTQSRRPKKDKTAQEEDKLPEKVIAQISFDKWKPKQQQKASDEKRPPEDGILYETSEELLDQKSKLNKNKKLQAVTLKSSLTSRGTPVQSSEESAVVHLHDTVFDREVSLKAFEEVAPKSSDEKPIKSSLPAVGHSPLTGPATEGISGQSIQKDKKGTRRRLSLKGTADNLVQTMKTKKMVKFLGSELTQRPTTAPDVKEEPESLDKDLTQTATAEQTEEAPKHLADQPKEIQEKKETKRWSKLLSLPKQTEKSERVIHGLRVKLQEIAREREGMIDIQTIQDVFEELDPSYKDTAPGPVTGRHPADRPAKISSVKKSPLPPDTAEQASTIKEKQEIAGVKETAPGQDISTALHEFQEATLACLEDKLEKLKKGPSSSGKLSVQFQPTNPEVQELFKAIESKVEECFLIKQKSFISLEEDRLLRSSQNMGELEDESGKAITKMLPPTQDTPTEAIPSQDTPTQDIPTQDTPTQDIPTQDTPTQVTPIQDTPTQDIPTQDTPIQDTPTQDIPTQDTPIQDTPTEDIPTQDTPIQDTPTEDIPTQDTPIQDTPTEDIPTQDTPTEDIPTQDTSTQDTPTEDTPIQDTPTQDTPTQDTPTQGTPTQDTPTQGTPTQDTPTQDAPTQDTPTQVTPSQGAPTQATPTQVTPTQVTPTQVTHSQTIPTQATPTQGTPTQDTPTQVTHTQVTPSQVTHAQVTPSQAIPIQDTPTQGTPTQDAPTQGKPTQGAPTQGAPTQGAPTQDAPTQGAPTQDAPTQGAPTQDAPTQGAPTQDAPTQGAPTQDAPTQGVPTHDAPTQGTPTQATPTQATPAQDTPTQAIPTQVTPMQITPTQAAPTQAAPTQGAPTQDTPIQDTPSQAIPTQVTPSQAIPTQYTPTQVTPSQAIPTQYTPTQVTPTQVTPSQTIPTQVIPTQVTPSQAIPTQDTPSHAIPTQVTPSQAIPTQYTPTQVTPSQAIPTQYTPTQVTPSQAIPTQYTPTRVTPTQVTPSQTIPTQDTPSHTIPTQVIPTQVTPSQAIPTQYTPTQVTPSQAIPTQYTPTQVTPSQAIPTQYTPTQVTPSQAIPTQYTPTQVTPTQVTPSQTIPTQDTPTQVTPTQVTPTQVTPTQVTPTQVTPSQTIPSQDTPTQVTPFQTHVMFEKSLSGPLILPEMQPEQPITEFSRQDELLPKLEEKEEDLAKALPPIEEEQSPEHVPDAGDQQVKELKQDDEDQEVKPFSEEQPKTVDRGKEPPQKASDLKLKSLQELNVEKELWYQQLQEQLLTEKKRMQEEQIRLQGECQRIEEAKKNLEQWQGLFQKQQEQWKQEQEQHKEQEHLWKLQLEHWQCLQQEHENQRQYWTEQREKQKEQQCMLQEEVRHLQQQYKEYIILRGEQAKEQWHWNQLKEEHRKQQEIWQKEDKVHERKRSQWQQQQAEHEEQMETLRQAQLEQEEQTKKWQEKQQELEHVWEKRWQQQLQSWHQQMQQQQAQERRYQEQKSKVLEKQTQIQKELKPFSPRLKIVESSVLDMFVKQYKISSMSKEKIISTTPHLTPSSSTEIKEDSSELETVEFSKLFTKTEELPTYGITEKRYWINVEAQRKNLKLLREAFQKAGISSDLYNNTKVMIKQALHSSAVRLALLVRKYKSFYDLHKVRQSLILQLDTAREAKDGAKIQNLYKMVDKVDAYQKKVLNNWKVKQNAVEKHRQHCLEKMVDLFARLHSNNKLHLSNPCLLMVKAGDSTQKGAFHMPHTGSVFLKSRVCKSPLIRVKKSQDFTLSSIVRGKPSSEQTESLWKTDITELSIPLGPKAPVPLLWSEACGFPDIPRFLELDISSVRRKPLQHIETRFVIQSTVPQADDTVRIMDISSSDWPSKPATGTHPLIQSLEAAIGGHFDLGCEQD